MTQHLAAEVATPSTSDQLRSGTGELSAREVADRVGRSTYWVKKKVRQGRFDHLRKGPDPEPGRRDVRPIYFTEEQARAVEAHVRHVAYVPAKGA